MNPNTYDYFSEFKQAIERTKKFGMTPEDFLEGEPAPPDADIKKLASDIKVPLDIRAKKSADIHHEAYSAFAKKYEVEITIGNVAIDGKMQYPATCSSLKKLAKHGKGQEQPVTAHVWITLPDGTILDYSLLVGLAQKNGDELTKPEDFIMRAKPDALPEGVTYHPYLIGVEFLYNCKWVPPDFSGFPKELLQGLFPGKI